MAKVHSYQDASGKLAGWAIECPACGCGHLFETGRWSFNGDMDRPTFSPSMLIRTYDGWTKIPEDQWMPVQRQRPKDGVSHRVPFALMSEARAERNHDQSLARLRQRCGMSAYEILCNLDDRGLWDRPPRPEAEELADLMSRVTAFCKSLPPSVCHSFVRDGRIEYLGDCTHALAGKTVDLLDW